MKILIVTLLTLVTQSVYCQFTLPPNTDYSPRFVCSNQISSNFTIGNWNIPHQDPSEYCPGNEVVVVSGSSQNLNLMESVVVSLVDPQNGFYDTRIQIQWKSGQTGVAKLVIAYYRNNGYLIRDGVRYCITETIRTNTLYFHRGIIEEPGELTAPDNITEFVKLDPAADPVSLELRYDVPWPKMQDLDLQRVRWFNGTSMDDKYLHNAFFDTRTKIPVTINTFGLTVVQGRGKR